MEKEDSMEHFIDLTPESMKTSEGVAKVNSALELWENSKTNFANESVYFLKTYRIDILRVALNYTNDYPMLEDFQRLLEDMENMLKLQEEFMKALANKA